jgi:hypothetical protein
VVVPLGLPPCITLMTAGVDYDVLGMNVVIACAGALVNMMFTMAMFLDNGRRDFGTSEGTTAAAGGCCAGLVAEEAPYELWV